MRTYSTNMTGTHTLPLEVIEIIFAYCDCTTLKALKNVQDEWKQPIESIIKKRCLRNIPDLERVLCKYMHTETDTNSGEATKLENICENWEKWQDIENYVKFENVPFIGELKYISCVSVFDDYIAIGLDTGVVDLYSLRTKKVLRTYKGVIEREPQTIHFVPGLSYPYVPLVLLIEHKDVTGIHDFTQNYQSGVFEHQRVFAAYKQVICSVGSNGTCTIAKIHFNDSTHQMSFIILKLVQLSVPYTNNIFASLSHNKCIILSDEKVLLVHFNEDNDKYNNIIDEIQETTSLEFEMSSVSVLWRDASIFYDKVIITNSQPRANIGQLFEIFLLQNGVCERVKTFHLSDVFESLITCVYLYGNTLVLGFANGEVLFYEVRDWEHFDLKNYSKRITMHTKLGRIISIDVSECYTKRQFYVSGPTFVRRITGISALK